MKFKNIEMEIMLEMLKPLLPHRDKVGYVAARNTRILSNTLTEYFSFKDDLIKKYGTMDKDGEGKETGSISVKPESENFNDFINEFNTIKDIEHDVELMTIPYDEVIGILNGEEILKLEWMFTE